MPAINFKKEFADAVESGEKTQTIRRVWKRPIKKGDTLYLRVGMRASNGRRLRKVVCLGVTAVKIDEAGVLVPWPKGHTLAGRMCRLVTFAMDDFAKKDGFDSVDAFLDFFRKQYGLPFEGVLIWWE